MNSPPKPSALPCNQVERGLAQMAMHCSQRTWAGVTLHAHPTTGHTLAGCAKGEREFHTLASSSLTVNRNGTRSPPGSCTVTGA